MKYSFKFVEEYIEVIAGYRDPTTNKMKGQALWMVFDPIISLARYDVNVLDSMAESASNGKALTTKQADLAVKIITKYQRQLAQKDIDVSPLSDPQWRLPLRVIDYSKNMYIENDLIMVEFPFNNNLIDGLRDFRKDSQGKGEWNKDKRRWEFDLTEYNLSYLITWAQTQGFVIDSESQRMNQLITEAEQTPYAIELDLVDGEFKISNAANSLINYINDKCGGFGIDNLGKLVDMSAVLGYTLSDSIKQAWAEQQGAFNVFMSTHMAMKLPASDLSRLESIIDYADQTQRWPVVIYEPDTSNRMLSEMWKLRGRSAIFMNRGKASEELKDIVNYKYIHTTVPLKNIKCPLLVSTAGLLYGGDKNLMLQNSEKQVFFAAEVATSQKQIKVVDFASETDNQG